MSPPHDRPLVVLDANILIRDFWMVGLDFRLAIDHGWLKHRPVVPEVALREAMAHLTQRIREERRRHLAKPEDTKLAARLERTCLGFHPLTDPAETIAAGYREHVESILHQADGWVLPLPEVEIEALVERSISRRRPFSRGDRGFRDSIIWHSLLDLLKTGEMLSFVTANQKDFADDDWELDSTLAVEAAALMPPHRQMCLHRSLHEFIVRFDIHGRGGADGPLTTLREGLLRDDLPGFSFVDWILNDLLEVEEMSWGWDAPTWAGVPDSLEELSIREITELVSYAIPTARRDGDTCHIYVEAVLSVVFESEFWGDDPTGDVPRYQLIFTTPNTHTRGHDLVFSGIATFLIRLSFRRHLQPQPVDIAINTINTASSDRDANELDSLALERDEYEIEYTATTDRTPSTNSG